MLGRPLNYIRIQYLQVIDREHVAAVACDDYDQYKNLPDAIEVNGIILGKTGWSSDLFYACYKQNVMLGKPVKIIESQVQI